MRVLFLATTTGYQTRAFGEAAERLGVKLVFATDRCDQLDDPWWDGAIPIRFHREPESVDAIVRANASAPVDGVLAVGDRATVIAAMAAARLGFPHHPPEAAAAARDKRLMRERLRAARLPVPWFMTAARTDDPRRISPALEYPVVIKPVVLSGSRGVIRADSPDQFEAAFARVARLLDAGDVRITQDAAADVIQVERYIPGREYALEGLLTQGELETLAIFDKPDPLEGPFFEETIYVTPSRASQATQRTIVDSVRQAAQAIGLRHGPIHAECRVDDAAVYVLEVAARPIGGLCARSLSFSDGANAAIGLEELLLRHALGEDTARWRRERAASGVMMIPIPQPGVFRRVSGEDRARAVPHVTGVAITAKADQQLVPLPEGASYLGFIFAKAGTPADVEDALRRAHAELSFTIDRGVPMLAAAAASRAFATGS